MESIDVSNLAEVSTESLDNANTFENIDEIPSNVEENYHLMDEKSGTEPTKMDEIPLKTESKVNLDDDVSEEA